MDRKTLFSLRTQLTPASIMMADRESYTEMTRLVPAPPTEAQPPGLNPRYNLRDRLPWWAAPAGGSNERIVLPPPAEAKPPGLNPRYPREGRLPWLAVAEEADGQEAWITAAHSDTVSPHAWALGAASSQGTSPGQTPPTEAKPPGLNPRYNLRDRHPWLAAPAGGSNERIVLPPPAEAKPPGLNPRYPREGRLPWLAVAEEADGQEAWITAAHSDTVSPHAWALGAASSQGTSPGQTPPDRVTPHHDLLVNMATTTKKHADLVSEPLGRKRSDALPGIGRILGQRLASKGFEKASMVVGHYNVLGKDEVRFNRWLHNTCGANNKQQYDCHKAIKEWTDSYM
ncbi:uncharacterized protein LOC115546977 [Gadus morhua]|uniref:Uncharacterized LOC115546977 n=1 Tax=Gadus morhua TaxID=8049 RepID=A0A8C5AVC8_GADMO|nr:uncharacterized protein LOC115546977 [Gadus morhua]